MKVQYMHWSAHIYGCRVVAITAMVYVFILLLIAHHRQ